MLLVSGLAAKVSAFALKDGTPAGDITAPGELAAAPFVTDAHGLPQVVMVARDVAKGTRLLAVRRSVDPPMNTRLAVLPNPITIAKPGTPGDPTATAPSAPATPVTPRSGPAASPPGSDRAVSPARPEPRR